MEITFNIANICNLKCTYCIFVGKGSGAPISDTMIHGVNSLLDFYVTEKNERTSLTFSGGGEPLLFFKDIEKIITSLNVKNKSLLDIYIITNGTIYNNHISEFIRKHNIFLVLSLDGCEKTHNINRVLENGNPTFEIIMKNSELLFKDVQDVNYTIFSNNFFHLLEGVKFIFKNFINLRRINFNFVFNSEAWVDQKLFSLKQTFDSLIDEYVSKQWYKKFETNLRNFSYLNTLESEASCLGHLYINRDGNVYKCGAYEFNFKGTPLGNLDSIKIDNIDALRKNVKNCSSKCNQYEYNVINKKLALILFYIGKKYNLVDKYIDNSLRKYNY